MCCLFFFPYWYECSPFQLTTPLVVSLWTELQRTWACQSGCCWNTTGKEIGQTCFTRQVCLFLVYFLFRHQKYKSSMFQRCVLFLMFLLLQMTEHLSYAEMRFLFCQPTRKMWERWKLRGCFGWNRFFSRIFLSKTKIGSFCSISEENILFEHKKIFWFGSFVKKNTENLVKFVKEVLVVSFPLVILPLGMYVPYGHRRIFLSFAWLEV